MYGGAICGRKLRVDMEPIFVVSCNLHACGVFSDLLSTTSILYIFGLNNGRTDN